jgi:hypothetical protein
LTSLDIYALFEVIKGFYPVNNFLKQ